MEANGQTLYNDDLLNILPDGVIILDINREVIQLNQQAFTELHVHSSVNAMMPLPTNKIFKLLNKKEDILSTILEEIRQGKKVYSLPEHTFMQEQVDYTQFPIRGEFATMENEEGEKNILFFWKNLKIFFHFQFNRSIYFLHLPIFRRSFAVTHHHTIKTESL